MRQLQSHAPAPPAMLTIVIIVHVEAFAFARVSQAERPPFRNTDRVIVAPVTSVTSRRGKVSVLHCNLLRRSALTHKASLLGATGKRTAESQLLALRSPTLTFPHPIPIPLASDHQSLQS